MQLTPYDTGDRLEPVPWVRDGITGTERPRPSEPDDYGRVDFDNEESASLLGVHVERDGDGYRMVVQKLCDQAQIAVEVREAWADADVAAEAVRVAVADGPSPSATTRLVPLHPQHVDGGQYAVGYRPYRGHVIRVTPMRFASRDDAESAAQRFALDLDAPAEVRWLGPLVHPTGDQLHARDGYRLGNLDARTARRDGTAVTVRAAMHRAGLDGDPNRR